MLFLRKNDLKLFVVVMLVMALAALSSIPGKLWMPFADFLPEWLTKEPLTYQVARLAPFILICFIIFGGIIIIKRWWE